ncbi:hypothetical protein O181_080138 [Austropuccinia psidii MF-1]|uniref:Integrase catalytic domain-containing protein n=1 Tax=Austropuccinia psidii MF-1 TaxID=1389203 RepID=A0A9Q3FI41_9BASI|nr:hypothetical protein [Austropuccinia psidii MF-1]
MNLLPCSSPIIPNSPKGEDLILAYDFLYLFNPIIDWKNRLITYHSSHKDSSGILPSVSNDFATAVNRVALVGERKTPSLPSSVHIPSIIPSQSLLPLRDEVFKEIKDVGEDVAISSLHLFQGDMDPPPLYFHASLEEQWDEEEEPEAIETVLKVVPPAYHQYLDVFSKKLARGESVPHYSLEPQAKLLLFKDRAVIPINEEIQLNILQKHHYSPLAGHPGQEKTLKLINRDSYWAVMNQFIKYYVSSCQQFSRNKNIHHKKFGLLNPLSIPSGPWNSLSIDFITPFPLSNSFASILVAVDRFSKMAIFIPAYGKITVLQLAQIFISLVFSKHVLPVSIISDRGSFFISSFWTQLCHQLKISRDLSTAFHPETGGQTERVNQIL